MRLPKLKKYIADIIEPQKKANALSIIYNILMSIIIILSCGFVFVDLFYHSNEVLNRISKTVELVAIIIFSFEYFLKLFVSEVLFEGEGFWKSKLSYVTSFDSFIDIISILSVLLNTIPESLVFLRLLKLVKLVRLVKLKDAIDEIREKEDGTNKEEKKENAFRFRVYEIISKDKNGDKLSIAYDVLSIVIIVLSVLIVAIDTFPIPYIYKKIIYYLEIVFAAFFTLDYVLRIWTADFEYPNLDKSHAKMKYIFSLASIIDIIAIVPIFFTLSPDVEINLPYSFSILKILKLLKMVRLLKMSPYLNSIHVFVEAVKKKKKQILFSIVILLFLIIICSILLYSFENNTEDSEFTNGFSGIAYFLKVLVGLGGDDALTEVHSIGGKVMLAIMLLCGGCVIGVPIGILSDEFTKIIDDTDKENEEDIFETFSKTLTNEQKIEIISKYHKKNDEINE